MAPGVALGERGVRLRRRDALLRGVDGVGFCPFSAADVMRHQLVQRIILAYDRDDQRRRTQPPPRRHELADDTSAGHGHGSGLGNGHDPEPDPDDLASTGDPGHPHAKVEVPGH